MKTKISIISLLVVLLTVSTACGMVPAFSGFGQFMQKPSAAPLIQPGSPAPLSPAVQPTLGSSAAPNIVQSAGSAAALAAIQGTLENIYAQVNPSVVNIEVTSTVNVRDNSSQMPFSFQFQFPFSNPDNGNGDNSAPTTRVQQALGSGFVYDNLGHIVTNNHVVDGADTVLVTFSDGRQSEAKIVGKDPDSDLAVIQVENGGTLTPLALTNSDQVKVGEMAIAIGNPFGLQGTMTVGYVSALGRTLPANETSGSSASASPSYTIPDVIQTDASINPGNSGGVLLNDQGQVIGVTSAIESSTRSNSGIGFVIPSNIVNRVVPELIKNGKFEHAYLGISGTDLSLALAKAMNLDPNQRGALVIDVSSGGPADKGGIHGGSKEVEINGSKEKVGGDVITAIDGQKVTQFDDLVSYLFKSGSIGQTVKLEFIRDGKQQSADVVLAARPAKSTESQASQPNPERPSNARAALGVTVLTLDSTLNQAMKLDSNQKGALVVNIIKNGPADQAGIRGGSTSFTYKDESTNIGGDVITALDGKTVANAQDLRTLMAGHKSGDKVTLTLLRDGKEMKVDVTLSPAANNN